MNYNKSYKCPNCLAKIEIDLKDYISDTSSREREMGAEIEYVIDCQGLYCDNCETNYAIFGSIWEYPADIENLDTTKIELTD